MQLTLSFPHSDSSVKYNLLPELFINSLSLQTSLLQVVPVIPSLFAWSTCPSTLADYIRR